MTSVVLGQYLYLWVQNKSHQTEIQRGWLQWILFVSCCLKSATQWVELKGLLTVWRFQFVVKINWQCTFTNTILVNKNLSTIHHTFHPFLGIFSNTANLYMLFYIGMANLVSFASNRVHILCILVVLVGTRLMLKAIQTSSMV